MKDYYQVLEISPQAELGDIKKAYFKMVRRFPPDRFPEEFKVIRVAYEILSNPQSREEYDSVNLFSPRIREMFDVAQELVNDGHIALSIKYLEDIFEEVPDSSIVQSILAGAYLRNNNTGKAIRMLETLIEDFPDNAGYRGNLAHAYLGRGWHKKAIVAYKQAIRMDGDNISLWKGLVQAYEDARDYSSCRKVLFEIINRSKNSWMVTTDLYVKVISLDYFLGYHTEMEKHLDEYVGFALEEDEPNREFMGQALYDFAKHLLETSALTPEIEKIVDALIKIFSHNKKVQQFLESIGRQNRCYEQLEELSEKKLVNLTLLSLLENKLLEDNMEMDPEEIEATRFFSELAIVESYSAIKDQIKYIKDNYPELYDLKANFFKDIRINRFREKFLAGAEGKVRKHGKVIEQMDFFMHYMGKMVEGSNGGRGGDHEGPVNGLEGMEEEYYWEGGMPEPRETYVRQQPKVGRNDPCPCGSGKKHKKCCGR